MSMSAISAAKPVGTLDGVASLQPIQRLPQKPSIRQTMTDLLDDRYVQGMLKGGSIGALSFGVLGMTVLPGPAKARAANAALGAAVGWIGGAASAAALSGTNWSNPNTAMGGGATVGFIAGATSFGMITRNPGGAAFGALLGAVTGAFTGSVIGATHAARAKDD